MAYPVLWNWHTLYLWNNNHSSQKVNMDAKHIISSCTNVLKLFKFCQEGSYIVKIRTKRLFEVKANKPDYITIDLFLFNHYKQLN